MKAQLIISTAEGDEQQSILKVDPECIAEPDKLRLRMASVIMFTA